MRQDRTLRRYLDYLREVGFEVVAVSRSKHWKITTRPDYLFVVSVTPSDGRAWLNFQAHARRAWLQSQPEPVKLVTNDSPPAAPACDRPAARDHVP